MKRLDKVLGDFEQYLQGYSTKIMRSFHPNFEGAFWEMVQMNFIREKLLENGIKY